MTTVSGSNGGAGSGRRSICGLLYLGFAIASIGGPIALVSLLPGAAGDALDSAGLVILLALAIFAAPLGIWLAYSRGVVTAGGLTAFVDAAAGRRAAVVHGWIWAFAYFLYLPYTVTYVVYDLLPPVFPGITAYRGSLELVLPVALVLFALCPVRVVLAILGLLAAAQLIAMAALGVVTYAHTSAPLAEHPGVDGVGRAAGTTALLFICASLPLYLGAEIRGGSRTVRRGLLLAFVLVGGFLLFAGIPLSGVPDELRDTPVPGVAIAQAYSGRELAVAVGLLTAGSVLALIVAEYLALARLLHWLHGPSVRTLLRVIAVPFVVADVISLADPDRFYDDLLRPSLAALFVSQLVVFAVFPRFRPGRLAIAAAAIGSALAAWGLYTLFQGGAST